MPIVRCPPARAACAGGDAFNDGYYEHVVPSGTNHETMATNGFGSSRIRPGRADQFLGFH
jgi:hypothetical protein